MPTSKKSNTTPLGGDERGRRIRQDSRHRADKVVPDARDVAAGLHPAPASTTSIDVRRSPDAGQALTLREQARALVITDALSHAKALEFVKGAKQLQRKIQDHWSRITRSIDDLKRSMLNFKAEDLGPVEEAIRIAEHAALTYANAERERVRLEEELRRQEAEAKARADREREIAEADRRALELEQQSENLSARELWFVEKVFSNGLEVHNPTPTDLRAMISIAKQSGYKDADTQVARLLRSPKILDAIKAKHDAAAIRQQAEAKRQQPIHVLEAPPVEANLARGRGLPTERTYYSAEVFDVNKLREAYLNGQLPAETFVPNETWLNAQARQAKTAEVFEQAFPGVRLRKKTGLAG